MIGSTNRTVFKIHPIVLFVIILHALPSSAWALRFQGLTTAEMDQSIVRSSLHPFPPNTIAMGAGQLPEEQVAVEQTQTDDARNQGKPKASKSSEKDKEPLAGDKSKESSKRSEKIPDEEIHWIIDELPRTTRQQEFSIMLAFAPSFPYGRLDANFGALLWYTVPILHKGLIPTINNALALEFGGFVGAGPIGRFELLGPILSAAGGVRWDFYLSEMWRAFATLKLGMTVWEVGPFGVNNYTNTWPIFPSLSLGSLFRLNETILLRVDLDFPRGLIAGITFGF